MGASRVTGKRRGSGGRSSSKGALALAKLPDEAGRPPPPAETGEGALALDFAAALPGLETAGATPADAGAAPAGTGASPGKSGAAPEIEGGKGTGCVASRP